LLAGPSDDVDLLVGLATLAGVVVIDVLPGLVIGVVSMILLLVFNARRPHISVLGRVPDVPDAYGDISRHPDYERLPGLLVLRLEAPLFYANASVVADSIKRLVGTSDPLPKAVTLDFGANSDLDITSSEELGQLVTSLHSAGLVFALAEVRTPTLEAARRSGVLATIGEDHVFHTIDEAVSALGPRRQAETTDTG
jgi:MFS superfamily sulfate permease-like transporter